MEKAKKLVAKATKTFDLAIADVEKANELMTAEMGKIDDNIRHYENEMIRISKLIADAKVEKKGIASEVGVNNTLIARLSQFTTGDKS